MTDPYRAFWLDPDWSGGDNLRDPGTEPFWMLPPKRAADPLRSSLADYGTPERAPRPFLRPAGAFEPEHECGPFVTLWTGYRYCAVCERPVK